jgi:rod shape-determining protein MreC
MGLILRKTSRWRLFIPLALIVIFLALIPQTPRRAPWYEQLFANVLAPIQWTFTKFGGGIYSMWDGYISLVGTKKENKKLAEENAKLNAGLIELEEVKKENERLKSLLNYSETFTAPTVTARVVANDPRAEFKSLIIDRGKSDGVKVPMPVMGPQGVVGRVGRVYHNTSQVLLLNDPNSAADVIVQRSRARGVLVGAISHTELKSGFYLTRMEYLRGTSDVKEGDVVVTSGLDQVFPAGLPIGTAHDIKNSRYGVFQEAEVVPFENFQELQEVVVLKYQPTE